MRERLTLRFTILCTDAELRGLTHTEVTMPTVQRRQQCEYTEVSIAMITRVSEIHQYE